MPPHPTSSHPTPPPAPRLTACPRGSSSAINICGAVRVAQRLGPGHTIVTVLCDLGSRYASKVLRARRPPRPPAPTPPPPPPHPTAPPASPAIAPGD
jgi:cysteine synthase A